MKLSKREIAEEFVNHFSIAWTCDHKPCPECPFFKEECPGNGIALVQCIRISEKWLEDNPEESGWEDLTLSDPPDLTKLYDFLKYEEESDSWYDLDIDNIEAVCEVEAGAKIRYRDRQPEKKLLSETEINKLMQNVRDSRILNENRFRDVVIDALMVILGTINK